MIEQMHEGNDCKIQGLSSKNKMKRERGIIRIRGT
jgi:hypothetical protein